MRYGLRISKLDEKLGQPTDYMVPFCVKYGGVGVGSN